MRIVVVLVVILTVAAARSGVPPSAAPLSKSIPAEAAVAFEIFQPAALTGALLSEAFAARLEGLPVYQQHRSTRQFQDMLNLVGFLEASLQTDWRTALQKGTSGGLAFALAAGNRHLLLVAGEDPDLLARLHAIAVQIATSEAGKQGRSDQVRSSEYAGVAGWTFNGQEAHAVVGGSLVAASDAPALEAALELRVSANGRSLADRASYQAARRATGANAVAMAFFDLEQLRAAPGLANLFEPTRQNPLAALALADLAAAARQSKWLALGFYTAEKRLQARAFFETSGAASGAAAFARPASPGSGAPLALEVPRRIAALSLYRELASFYAAKDVLFPERTSGLIFFENMMGIFFSGRNFTDEVLAQTHPDVQLVVARQDFDRTIGVPEPQLPAFALVLRLRDAAAFGEILEEAWQKALGLINFTRGQKAFPGLIIDRPVHQGHPITVAYFSAKEVEDRSRLDQRFNFRPALVIAHGHAILSSTDQLARDLMDALAAAFETGRPARNDAHTRLELGGAELAAILKSNRPALVRQNMVKEGNSQAAAEAAVDTMLTVADWVQQATLEVGGTQRPAYAELTIDFSR